MEWVVHDLAIAHTDVGLRLAVIGGLLKMFTLSFISFYLRLHITKITRHKGILFFIVFRYNIIFFYI